MVGFGKQLKEKQLVEWQPYYISYKSMKKAFKQYGQRIQHGGEEKNRVHKDFSKMLDNEIEKIVLFLLEQQGALAERLSKLGEEREKFNSAPGQEPSFEKICQLRDGYRQVGQDLLRLNFFMETNATGIRKILKKFDKRFGSGFTDYYVRTRANHPYSQLQQVFKHVGIGAVAGAITRNLGELQECHGSYASIYDKPAMSLQDPIIDKIHAAVDKLTNSTSLLRFIAKRELITEEELAAPLEEQAEVDGRYDFMSLMLNLINTFLYMINTYIIVPTADDYSMNLGAAATVCGVVIGSMAIAQVFSSVYFSAWSNRSYFKPLVFSSIVLFLGNLMYAMAYDLSSIWLLLIGRLFCGLGSARAVNRRYISDCVPIRIRMQASAGFVSASALGMACGPALAAALQTNFKIYGFTFNEDTLPGWLMAVSWLLYLVLLGFCFKEPVRDHHEPKPVNNGIEVAHGGDALEKGLTQPLLLSNGGPHDDNCDNDEGKDESEEAVEDSRKPANSIGAAYRLLTPSTKAQLLVYFMLKYSMEVLLSESSVITTYYFSWSTNGVALFLGALGALVLPVNYVVGKYLSNMFQERQILLASEIIVCLGIIASFDYFFIKYSVPQYVISGVIMFVAAEVLEGVNLSLLSQVMSSRLARGTYNVGLLSTEAGTLARVVADGTITVVGYLVGESRLLNITLIPSLLICIVSIIATRCTFNSLY